MVKGNFPNGAAALCINGCGYYTKRKQTMKLHEFRCRMRSLAAAEAAAPAAEEAKDDDEVEIGGGDMDDEPVPDDEPEISAEQVALHTPLA